MWAAVPDGPRDAERPRLEHRRPGLDARHSTPAGSFRWPACARRSVCRRERFRQRRVADPRSGRWRRQL